LLDLSNLLRSRCALAEAAARKRMGEARFGDDCRICALIDDPLRVLLDTLAIAVVEPCEEIDIVGVVSFGPG
jgi:hypothetical protein